METVTLEKKKAFIKWILNAYQFSHRGSVWIFNYCLTHDNTLENLHFVEKANQTPNGIQFSLKGSSNPPISYYENEELIETDPEKVFHKVRLDLRKTNIYVEILFDEIPSAYYTVLEENPYRRENEKIPKAIEKQIDELLGGILRKNEEQMIQNQINEALDRRDEELFFELTNMIRNTKKLTATQ